jgi:hypothetical protein
MSVRIARVLAALGVLLLVAFEGSRARADTRSSIREIPDKKYLLLFALLGNEEAA